MLRRREENSLNNYTSYLDDYERSSLALDRGRKNMQEEIGSLVNKIKLSLVIKMFSERKRV